MMLYLVRHGIAEVACDGMSDESRALTAEGEKKFTMAVRGLAEIATISHVFSSPLVRAMQTAKILCGEMKKGTGGKLEVKVERSLAPPGRLEALLEKLRALPVNAEVAAVGHEQILGPWVGELCFGKAGRVEIKKGGIAAIELVGKDRGELKWLMQPRQLRRLG